MHRTHPVSYQVHLDATFAQTIMITNIMLTEASRRSSPPGEAKASTRVTTVVLAFSLTVARVQMDGQGSIARHHFAGTSKLIHS